MSSSHISHAFAAVDGIDDEGFPSRPASSLVKPAPVAPTLDALLASAAVWRGKDFARVVAEPSGHASLDAKLPGGGWPVGALTELLLESEGIGELSLVMPWLARLTQAGGRVALVDPPHLPYAPALAQAGLVLARTLVVRPATPDSGLWALEQSLRNGACGAVVGWLGFDGDRSCASAQVKAHRQTVRALTAPGTADLRRLQLAAETGHTTALLFRPASAVDQPSMAALRLRLATSGKGRLRIDVVKARGGAPATLELEA